MKSYGDDVDEKKPPNRHYFEQPHSLHKRRPAGGNIIIITSTYASLTVQITFWLNFSDNITTILFLYYNYNDIITTKIILLFFHKYFYVGKLSEKIYT